MRSTIVYKAPRQQSKYGGVSGILGLLAFCFFSGLVLSSLSVAYAEAPITSSGLGTQISPAINLPDSKIQYDITGGIRPGNGPNLFHSFGEFNVPSNNIANFLNDSGLPTANVLGRVTEGNPSHIFGTLQTTGFENANLFLMNPAGFLFGPNATVNVGGMVAFTSADYLKLTDNALFNAIPDVAADILLTALPVAAFGFLGSNPGAITVQGSQFSVADGQSISLVGGNITIEAGTLSDGTVQPAQLSAPNGQINLASAASPGEFLDQSMQADANVNGEFFTSFGSVLLLQNSRVDVSHGGIGTVSIRGGHFVLTMNNAALTTTDPALLENPASTDNISLRNGSAISSVTQSLDPGAEIELSGGELDISVRDGSVINSSAFGGGPGGNITLDAGKTITVSDGGSIQAFGDFGSPSGIITIKATDSVTLSGQSDTLAISNQTLDVGQNGGIVVESGKIEFKNGTEVLVSSFFDPAGPITITGITSVDISASRVRNTSTFSESGPLAITASSITLDQASLSTRTSGPGDAGLLELHATSGDLVLSNGTKVRSSSEQGSGSGGDIWADAVGSVKIFEGSSIESIAFRTGPAGFIVIAAQDSVVIDGVGSGIFSTTQGSAPGGNITSTAGQSVTISDGASLSASSTGPGNTGNIQIDAGNQFTMTNSSVTTEANFASGGAIKITTNPSGTVQLTNSTISASVLDGTSGGGSVDIDPLYVILQNSQILAQAVQGPGGNITISITNGGLFLPDATSTISASSQFGVNGTVIIQSPNAPGSGKIQPLGKTPLEATSLLNQHCAALAGGEFSSFTVAGRNSLPTEPSSWLTSPLYAAGVGLGVKAEGGKAEGERLETPLLSLRQIAPAGFLTQAFAVDWSAGCQS